MKKLRYLTLATALCLLLCSCNKSEPIDNSNSSSTPTEILDMSSNAEDNTESSTDNNAQNYAELYERLYEEIYEKLYDDIYEDVYVMVTREIHVDNYVAPLNCEKIDLSLDCEKIVLDRAETLKKMITNYYNGDPTKLAFKKDNNNENQGFEFSKIVISEEFNSYSKFKELFNNNIYDKYIDVINYSNNGFRERQGKLYFSNWVSGGPRGTAETWYLGYDVEDDRIIGHFAELQADVGSNEPLTAEFLNDESNYNFYDIIIQNVDGNYVITNCVSSDNEHYYLEHGLCYNSGFSDRSLITNPKVMPKK